MIERVIINVEGNDKGVDSTISKLQKMGKVDKENAAQFEKTNKAHQKNIEKTGQQVVSLTEGFEDLGKKIIAAFAIERISEKFLDFLKESIKLYAESEAQLKRLQFAVTQINGEGVIAFKELVEQSEQLSKSLNSLFTPEQINAVQIQLANFGLASDKIRELTPRILDLSRATGKDLSEVTQKFILALNGQTKGLRDVGISFKDTGSKAENFNKLMQDTAKFTGAAADSVDTLDGQMTSLNNKFEETQVSVGKFLSELEQDALAAFGDVTDAVTTMIAAMNGAAGISNMQRLQEIRKVNKEVDELRNKIMEMNKSGDLNKQNQDFQKMLDDIGKKIQTNTDIVNENQRNIDAVRDRYKKSGQQIDEVDRKNLNNAQKIIDLANIQKTAYSNLLKELDKVGQKTKEVDDLTLDGEQKKLDAMKKAQEEHDKIVKESLEALMKLNEEMQRIAKMEADEFRKILEEQKTPLEKEQELYDSRVKLFKSLLNQKLISQEEYDKVSEKELKRHEDEMTKIEQDAAQKRLDNLKKEMGVKQGEEEKLIKFEKAKTDEIEEHSDEKAQSTSDYLEKQAESIKVFFDSALNNVTANIENAIKMIDHQEELQKQNIETQRRLAELGKKNTLDAEEEKLNELEKKRQQEEKKLKKAKELETFLNSVAKFSETDPKTAITKALAQVGLVKAVEALYAEEGGLIGSGMLPLSTGKRHPGGGDVLIHAQTGEGMLSRKDIAAMGGPHAFLDFKESLKYNFREKSLPLPGSMVTVSGYREMVDELKAVKQEIKNKPDISIDFEGLYNMLLNYKKNGITTTTKYVPPVVIGGNFNG